MRLRVRHPEGVLTVEDLAPEQSVETLCKTIESLIGISSEKWVQGNFILHEWRQKLLKFCVPNNLSRFSLSIVVSGGFPPKPITDRTLSLQMAGIKNGDALNVTLIDPPPSLRNVTSSSPAVAIRDGFLVQRVGWIYKYIYINDREYTHFCFCALGNGWW